MDEEGQASTVESSEEPAEGGWTNEYVREGFDVDGAESRISPLGMDRRVRLVQAHYAVWQGAWGDGRALYPVVRRLGALLGRERAAEQYVAESEYLLQQRAAIDRDGVGSRRWWLGLAFFLGYWLLMLAVATTGAVVLVVGLPSVLTTYLGVAPAVAQGLGLLLFLGLGIAPLVWLVYWSVARRNHDTGA